ncbi:hypothetical protein Sfulv_58620 [Streptomyces fulvorobeus]|uniref:Uncharacterized protein n=1 Tax=Streptomyces fulvorobeus TaxID=284028 RepID=A0A7J0CEZ1_9ACTN|nr:hypothetical protein Sfulv_58620 [Streptomyces fulvorobeus]
MYLPPVPSVVGSSGRTESPHVVAATTLAFLDTTLRHKPGDLAGVLSAYSDLSVFVGGTAGRGAQAAHDVVAYGGGRGVKRIGEDPHSVPRGQSGVAPVAGLGSPGA